METYRKEDIRRGDIYYADLSPVFGSEQGRTTPCGHSPQNNVGTGTVHSDRRRDHQPKGVSINFLPIKPGCSNSRSLPRLYHPAGAASHH